MDVIISVAGKIGEYLVAPIGRQFGYVLLYKSNVGVLKDQVKELENKKIEVQGRTAEAVRNGDIILPSVTSWLERVDEITQESSYFFDGEDQVRKGCFNVPYLDLKSLYKRGRLAKKKMITANELQQCGSFERVSVSVRPSAMRFKSIEAVDDFESRKLTMERVKEAIEDPKVKMIGIYGIGGVGKTTLVKEVAKQAEVSNQFEEVVMAVVSQTLNLKGIQQQIAEMLGVNFGVESELGRAERLHARLKKKNVLVILDDIWNPVNLEAIGIPFGVEDQGCKIVFTSRSKDVCNQMPTQRNVEVGILVKEEAWNLFRKMAGDVVDSPQIKPLASKVVKRCSGLPIAIVTIARALKDKSLSFWKDAANRSRISMEVSSTLQLSYDYLESEEAKSFFLLCCIYGEGHNIAIEDLWKYGMGLGSFQGLDSVEVARDRAYALAEILKYSCLLQEGRNKDYVRMHDVVRGFAISVASKGEHGFLVRSGPEWNKFPDSNQFIRYTAISLISNAIQKLPDDRLECVKLELLYLECTHPSLQIPDKFFLGMKKLKVVVMSNMHFQSLPPSLADLENLQTFCLSNCNLQNVDLSIIGKLKGLKFLSFIGSNMKKLPKEIGELIHLKLLDLSQCHDLKLIPRDVILRLSRLEGLYMGGSSETYGFKSWEIEEQNTKKSNVSVRDLKHLPNLTSLKLVVPVENCLPDGEDSLFKSLARFQMCIGTDLRQDDYFLYSKALILVSLRNISSKLLSTPFKTTEYLYMDQIRHGLGSVLYDLEGESVLKCLTVKDCDELEYVFNTKNSVLPAIVCSLEKLDLSYLPNLKGISHGQLSHVCFRNLRVVKVKECDGLKNLFSHFKATDLQELNELRVEFCEIMEEIFGDEIGASSLESIVFQSLQVLELKWLPKLINFCSKTKCTDTQMKNPLFDEKVMFPVLEKLMISRVNVKDIWHHQLLDNFKNLSSIRIYKCDGLKSLFRSSMASSLRQLQEVEIDSCKIMETIIWKERDADEESCMEKIVFPQLHRLRLGNLPNLASFYQMACPSKEANNLEDPTQPLPLFGEKVAFPLLETLTIARMGNLKEIWHPQLTAETFPRLKVLEVRLCQELLNVIPLYMLPKFWGLDQLTVRYCNSMEEVIGVEGMQGSESLEGIQLRILELDGLPKLKSLFSPSVARSLVQLQKVNITDCESMETIIANEKQGEEDCIEMINVFPQLHNFQLYKLPNLTSFYLGTSKLNWPSLKILMIQIIRYRLDHNLVPPLFNEKVIFPALEKLVLTKNHNLKEIWHPQIPSKSFSKLKVLEVRGCHKLSSVVPFSLLQSLQSLEELSVVDCDSMEEVIGVEGMQGSENLEGIQFRILTLDGLPKLKSLFSLSVARRLVQLKKVTITDCESMETIIANEKQGEEEDCIEMINVFPQLHDLELENLPNFTGFYLGTNTLNLLSLKILSLEDITVNLHRDPMPPLFDKTVIFPALEKLVLVNVHNLKETWHSQIPVKSFSQLKVLEVSSCNKFSSVVSSSMLQRFQSLEELSIVDCDLLEEVVVEVEGHEVNELIFPRLRKLRLEKLPKLKHIMCWDKNPQETPALQSLISIHIIKCNSLRSLLSPSEKSSNDSCEQMEIVIAKERQGEENCLNGSSLKTLWIQSSPAMKRFTGNISCPQNREFLSKEVPEPGRPCPFFHNKVALASLEQLYIHSMENVEEIFDNQLSDESLCQLRVLSVRTCDKLLRVIPSNLLPRLNKLQQLTVKNCNLVEEISEQGLEEGQATTISFTDLKKLELENLPNLKIFCYGNYTIECPSLYWVMLKNCPKIQTFSSGSTSVPVLKTTVEQEGSKNMWKGDLNITIQQLFHEKELLKIKGGLGGDGSPNKLDSGPVMEEDLQTPGVGGFIDDMDHDMFPEDITRGGGQNNVMSQDVQNNMEGKISTETRVRLLDNKLNCMPNQDDSTSTRALVIEENPRTIEKSRIRDIEDQCVHQNEDAWVVGGDEPSCQQRIISSEEKGKAKVLDEGSEKVSHMDDPQTPKVTGTLSHQPQSDSDISIRGSAMEDSQTPKVDGNMDVADAGAFPNYIARGAPGDQKVCQNPDSVQGFVALTEAEAEADLFTWDTSLSRVAGSHPTFGRINKIHPNEMVSRAEFESLQRDRDLLRRRVETVEDLLSNTRPGEMVTAELESVQRDRDLLRQRVETLEELLVTGYRGGRPPSECAGRSMTHDIGWATWSLLFVFGLLYFFAQTLNTSIWMDGA